MQEYPFYQDQETAPTPRRGGCFSLLIIPLATILIITAWLRFLHGGSDSKIALQISVLEIPASAHSLQTSAPKQEMILEHGIALFFAPSVLFWEEDILKWAGDHDLDPNLVATVMQIESCGDPRALSSAGAMGLFQVMPYHFEENEAPYNPDINALRGLNIFRIRLKPTAVSG